MTKRNAAIDLIKYIASLMIIAIHTGLFSDVNETLNFVVVDIICRAAVPYFAVCSGYFLACRLDSGETMHAAASNSRIFVNQEKKLLRLYAVWTVLYLFHSIPMWIETGWFSPWAFVDYTIGALTKGSHYHFWYLWGMIYTIPVFYLFLRFCRRKYWELAVVILWVMEVMSYAYGSVLPEPLAYILGKMGTLLCLLPLLIVGAIIATRQENCTGIILTGLILSYVGLFAEAFYLRNEGQDNVSYLFSTLPAAYFLFCLILKIQVKKGSAVFEKLGGVSMFVYCIHPMLVELTDSVFSENLIHFVFVSVTSTLLGFAYLYLRKKMKRKKVELCSN